MSNRSQQQSIQAQCFSHLNRRRFLGLCAGAIVATYVKASRADTAIRNSTAGGTLKHLRAGVLDVAYLEAGPANGPAVLLLHGFPYDVHSYDVAAAQLAARGRRVIVPYLRGYGPTRFLQSDSPRVGQQAALGSDLLALLDGLSIDKAALAGYDWGGRAACVVAALWPERVSGLVSCGTGYNIQNSAEVLKPTEPEKERLHWYWFYLNSERGKAALAQNRSGLCRYLWQDFSPTWHFDEATFARTAPSFDNPDFVEVVLHSYRYRIGAVSGDPHLNALEQRLAAEPRITVPTIVLQGADDGVDRPLPLEKVEPHFTTLRRMATLDHVGHNLPQEAPDEFAAAILELGKMR